MSRFARWLGSSRIRAVFARKVNPRPILGVRRGRNHIGLPAGWDQQVDGEPGLSAPSMKGARFTAIFARNSE